MITTSTETDKFFPAFLAAKKQMRPIFKGNKSQDGKYKYASLGDFVEAVEPILLEHGLVMASSTAEAVEQTPWVTKNGDTWKVMQVTLAMRITHVGSQQWMEALAAGQGADPQDKSTTKAQTVARRYALAQIFNLTTTDDPEAAGWVQDEPAAPPQRKAAPRQQQAPAPPPAAKPDYEKIIGRMAPGQVAQRLEQSINKYGYATNQEEQAVLAFLCAAAKGRDVAHVSDLLEDEADDAQLRKMAVLLALGVDKLTDEQRADFNNAPLVG